MSLKAQITADVKTALKAGDRDRVAVLRMATAAIKQVEIDGQKELDDAGTAAVVEKMVKQRQDSVKQFTKGGRDDLANKEAAEIEILKGYLPEPLSESELAALIDETVTSLGATGMADMGKVMAAIKGAAAGRADMGAVSREVKARLSS